MSVYLKQFETQAAYEAAQSGLILPNVSLTVDNNTVHYNPSSPTPPTPSHDYVEIGGIKWATMNVGANSVTDYGLYFQWGDTQGYTADQVGSGEGQKYFSWADYKYNPSGDGSTMTKYNNTDHLTTLEASDDAVQANWGGSWRMPTAAEFQALGTATTSAWTSSYEGSGVSGLVLTDKTDSSKTLFFPAADSCSDGWVSVGANSECWSNSLYSSNVYFNFAYYLVGYSDGEVHWMRYTDRYYGKPVRGVLADS